MAGNNPNPPLPAPDPTLISRPVPHQRTFTILSFRPTTAAPTTTPCRTLDDIADHSTYPGPGVYRPVEDVRQLLRAIDSWANVSLGGSTSPPPALPDRTWGYYVFLTAYDQTTLGYLPTAMEKWVRVQERALDWHPTLEVYRAEAKTRFRLDVVVDAEELDGASDARIRANFRALVRGLGWDDSAGMGSGWPPMARSNAALVVGADEVRELASLDLREEERGAEEFERLRTMQVKVIDINYEPDEDEAAFSEWRGTGAVSINRMMRPYAIVTKDANGGAVMDNFSA